MYLFIIFTYVLLAHHPYSRDITGVVVVVPGAALVVARAVAAAVAVAPAVAPAVVAPLLIN